MLVKKIKYTDYNGVEREEEFYFNLNKAEIIKWLTTNGNYTIDAVLEKMIKTENVKDMINEFETLIMMSYGVKSLDGKRFIKSQEVKDEFHDSEAYSVLFMELVSDASKAADFFNKICPPDLASEVNKIMAEHPEQIPEVVRDYMPQVQQAKENNIMPMPTATV